MQVRRFFMRYMRVTQGYGRTISGAVDYTSYSHGGSYAMDFGGRDANKDWAYAPCDVMVRNLVFVLKHMDDSDMDSLGIEVGRIFRQGEKFYREGSHGTIGNHIHLEVGLGPFDKNCMQKTSIVRADGKRVFKIKNQLMPHEIFFVSREVLILDAGEVRWKTENFDRIKI